MSAPSYGSLPMVSVEPWFHSEDGFDESEFDGWLPFPIDVRLVDIGRTAISVREAELLVEDLKAAIAACKASADQ